MEFEGYIDKYGMPVLFIRLNLVGGIDGEDINIGAIDYWKNEVDVIISDPTRLMSSTSVSTYRVSRL